MIEPQVLLLDDPFSAIDKDTEALIAPEIFSSDKTLVWITHRYSFLKEMDQVVYLDDGEIKSIENGKDLESGSQVFLDFLARTGYQGVS